VRSPASRGLDAPVSGVELKHHHQRYSKRLSLRNQQIEITRWTFARFPYAGQKSAG